MQRSSRFHGTRRYVRALLWLLGAFALLTLAGTARALTPDAGEESWMHWLRIAETTASVPLGPFTGAIARRSQDCCANASWRLLPVASIGLALALSMLLVPLPSGLGFDRARFGLWIAGWFVWFASGILSLGHALE